MSLPGVNVGSPKAGYDVVIIGAGIQGLATAYELTKLGVCDVAVIDRSWPGGGASGRNGELIRSIFSSEEWTNLFDASLRRWHDLSAELDFNVLFNSAGYLVVASNEEEWARARRDHESHRSFGVQSELLDADTVTGLVPDMNPDLVAGALFQKGAGHAHHDAANWAYLRAAARGGVDVFGGMEVLDIEIIGTRVTGVRTSEGKISAPIVVNAAGGGALAVNRMLGIELPMIESRLEILVTESLAPFLRYSVAAQNLLGYCHQTARGEFVGGTELAGIVDETTSLNSTWPLLKDMTSKWTRLFPRLAGARLLRHWAGTLTQSADLAPVIGQVDVDGYWMSCGWTYGFMAAPSAAEMLARHIATGELAPVIAPFAPQRLIDGDLIAETSLVVPKHEGSS